MCGLVGFWGHTTPDEHLAVRMANQIRRRGPDDSGVWCDSAAGLAIAHRRLSVIDLSIAGHQPMVSSCGQYVLAFNGEIYNHQDLRLDLERDGVRKNWRGLSDTETLLAALIHWGVEDALVRVNGMFAFALWDRRDRCLFLARDRMGEKPLYYGQGDGVFLFGSELGALTIHPQWRGSIDRDALTLYMRHNYVPAPWSIYEGIFKLQPAHFLVIREGGISIAEPQCYWNLHDVAERGQKKPVASAEEMTDQLDQLLRDAIGRRMMSDVPLGALLSGGFDSTTVVALMQEQSNRPVQTFSIGFHEDGYNEAEHAKAVASHLGTDHTELYVTSKEAMAIIPKLPSIWNEPFSDSSQIPTFLVCELARQHVTVCLSGDGGDELFCGYNRYNHGYRIWRQLNSLPRPMRAAVATLLRSIPGVAIERLMRLLPSRFRMPNLGDRLPKLADVITEKSVGTYYRSLISHWKDPSAVILNGHEPRTIFSSPELLPDFPDLRQMMMYLDTITYLPDDILTKVDRASMAVSLEARVPLIDHRLVEFAWQIPMDLKLRSGRGKWLLREVLYRYVPRSLMDRPKMGFGVPIEHWLRGPLRDWAEDLLSESRLRQEGFFDPNPIRKMWQEHLTGNRRWHYHLWDVLMFQAWLAENRR